MRPPCTLPFPPNCPLAHPLPCLQLSIAAPVRLPTHSPEDPLIATSSMTPMLTPRKNMSVPPKFLARVS